jgi:pulcherriminic acid synthase
MNISVDLHSEEFYRNPFTTFEFLRNEKPVFYDEIDKRWVITRYVDVADVLRNHRVFSAEPYSRFTDVIGLTMAHMDGKDHDSRRSIVAPPMVGKNLEESLLPHVRSASEKIAGGLDREGPFEARSRLGKQLPLKTMVRLLGLSEKDEGFLSDVTTKVIRALQGDEPYKSIGKAAHDSFALLLANLIGERGKNPESDLLTSLINSEDEEGNRLSESEVISFMSLLLVAGSETTELGLTNFLQVLLSHPDHLSRAETDSEYLNACFTEFMRRDCVVAYEDRGVTEETEIHGVSIKPGEFVRVALLSANNDETIFNAPREFNPSRTDLLLEREHRSGGIQNGRANHLGFGLGKHFCIGYMLARAEVVTITEMLLKNYSIAISPLQEEALKLHWWNWSVNSLLLEAKQK